MQALDRFEEAIRECSTLVQIDPMPWSITYSNLVTSRLLANHLEKVSGALARMKEINPHSRFFLNVKCFSQLVNNNFQDAEKIAIQMLELDVPWQSKAQTSLANIKILQMNQGILLWGSLIS